VVNCSSLYFWNAGTSFASTLSPSRIDLIALVTSASYVVLETRSGSLVGGCSTSPGGALSTKDERALSADILNQLLRYPRSWA
jgi:hypothetical protein